jgi:hypothetical protein
MSSYEDPRLRYVINLSSNVLYSNWLRQDHAWTSMLVVAIIHKIGLRTDTMKPDTWSFALNITQHFFYIRSRISFLIVMYVNWILLDRDIEGYFTSDMHFNLFDNAFNY